MRPKKRHRTRMDDLLALPVDELPDLECVEVVRHLNRKPPGAQHPAPMAAQEQPKRTSFGAS